MLTEPQWKWYWAQVYSAPRFRPSNLGTFTPSPKTLTGESRDWRVKRDEEDMKRDWVRSHILKSRLMDRFSNYQTENRTQMNETLSIFFYVKYSGKGTYPHI